MLALVAALLLTNHPAAQASVKPPQLPSADDLVDWVVKYGGQVCQTICCAIQTRQCQENVQSCCACDVQTAGTVAQHPKTSLRGVFASRDIKKGEVAVIVPINISMDIGPAQWTSAVCPSGVLLENGMQSGRTAVHAS